MYYNIPISYKQPWHLNKRLPLYQAGRDVSTQLQPGRVQPSGGGFASSVNSMIPFVGQGMNFAQNIQGLTDDNKYNQGASWGGMVGTGVDTVAQIYGINTMGLGNKAGQAVGGIFDKNKWNERERTFNPSGNTTGNYPTYQMGGMIPQPMSPMYQPPRGKTIEPTAEIEGGEYIYNIEGIDKTNFRMLNNTGLKHDSPFGFQAQGAKHGRGNSKGIKVNANVGYIASQHLGIDGKKAGKNNSGVADLMLKYGGKALASGEKNKWDKFGINAWNPNAVMHHLKIMEGIKNDAEFNKEYLDISQNFK